MSLPPHAYRNSTKSFNNFHIISILHLHKILQSYIVGLYCLYVTFLIQQFWNEIFIFRCLRRRYRFQSTFRCRSITSRCPRIRRVKPPQLVRWCCRPFPRVSRYCPNNDSNKQKKESTKINNNKWWF